MLTPHNAQRTMDKRQSQKLTMSTLCSDIIGTNRLHKFHDDRTINVASRVKNAQPPGGHVFKATETIIDLIQDIIGTNLLTKFHEDRKINVASRVLTRKNAPPPGGNVFQPTDIIFELFHEDRTINVASRVLTRFYYSHTFFVYSHIRNKRAMRLMALT
ncbi:hypothetical protein DPMN_165732 [Dreissena polymorpha]|uniref:Uncharacterized protein n=1 Tax=Dreissena polymorpha TaxID=45954 RepID=A0A9D4EXE9_DREPO|nr:hypothetical protein DPMN_165732 [Dreissena polymorpha]